MLSLAAVVMTGFVALEHIAFLVLEMFFWDHDIGRTVFSMTAEESAISAPLAMQQGLYNGFLAAGLIWGLLASRRDVITFFLICVIAAGVFAGLTVKPSIVVTQGAPALIALILTWAGAKRST